LQELWARFQEGNEEVSGAKGRLVFSNVRLDDDDDCETEVPASEPQDADFGLSDEQLAELAREDKCQSVEAKERAKRSAEGPSANQVALIPAPTTVDPLRRFADEKAARRQEAMASDCEVKAPGGTEPSRLARPRRRSDPQALIDEQLPRLDPERTLRLKMPAWKLQATLISSKAIDGVTWYLFKLQENNEARFYMKRFSDFRRLDRVLRSAPRPGRQLPTLPPSGRFGLRHMLDIGDFNRKRAAGLRIYVEDLLTQVGSLTDEPALVRFFGRGAGGRVLPPVAASV